MYSGIQSSDSKAKVKRISFHTSKLDGPCFFPGQASLAYFFFRGSSPISIGGNWALAGCTITLGSSAATSISGAGFGSGRPSFEDNDVKNGVVTFDVLESGRSSYNPASFGT